MENFDNFLNPYFSGFGSSDIGGKCEDNYTPTSPLPKNPVPTMAYIPFQQFSQMYSSAEGFRQGTIFPCLDKPFLGKGGCNI